MLSTGQSFVPECVQMPTPRPFVAYYRVSTAQQGRSGLGLDAQRAAVTHFTSHGDWQLLAEFTETESGKGSNALERRPQLREAMAMAKKRGATVVIAKLDRLARNVHFISGLIEQRVEFVAADMPTASKEMINIHSVMSEWERDQISRRTKLALDEAKKNGRLLGVKGRENLYASNAKRSDEANAFALRMKIVITDMQAAGRSQRQIVEALNNMGARTSTGKQWNLTQLQRVLTRIKAAADSSR